MICPTCDRTCAEGTFCPFDGARLVDPAAEQAPVDSLLGRILGQRYQLDQRIGSGGMGTVYKARHVLMEKPVAVKVLRPELGDDTYAAGRFRREARSASRIEHENCVAVTDFGQEEDGTQFLVMEYVEGRTLWQELKASGAFPPERAVAVAIQIARALAAAHQQGVVHRDLKPENVMLVPRDDRRELVKVLDFGLAKVVQTKDDAALTALTRHGMIFGTPRYMSPEQIEGRETDPRADLYGFGVVLYEMVTGLLPFEDRSVVALLNKHVHDPPMPPSLRLPELELPVRLEQLILALLAKKVEDRPPGARDVVRWLEEIEGELRQGELPSGGPGEEEPSAPPRFARRVPGWLLPALGGALAASALTVLVLTFTGTPTGGRAPAPPLPGSTAQRGDGPLATAPSAPATGPPAAAAPAPEPAPLPQALPAGDPGAATRADPPRQAAPEAATKAVAPRPAAGALPAPAAAAATKAVAPAEASAPPATKAVAPREVAVARLAPAPAPPATTAPLPVPAGGAPTRAAGPAPLAGPPEPLAADRAHHTPDAPAAEASPPPTAAAATPAGQAELLVREAHEALGRRHYDIAGKLLGQALSSAPANPHVHMAFANLHFERGRFDAALRSTRRAVELEPAGTDELLLQGQIAYKSGDRELACRSFHEVLRLHPEQERAQRYLTKVGCP